MLTVRLPSVLLCLVWWLALPHPTVAAVSATPPRPLEFTPNHGQWPAAVRLRTDVAPGLSVFLENRTLTFLRYDAPAWAAAAHRVSGGGQADSAAVQAHAWAVELVGARATAHPEPSSENCGPVRHYFVGKEQRRWAPNVRATTAARYANVWPGISVAAHASPEGAFEVDFEVKPGADAAKIRLRYSGLKPLVLNAGTGRLRLQTALGEVQEAAPVAWQTTAGGLRIAVPCRFVLQPSAGGGEVSFALPTGYDHTRALLIDPVLIAATYSGSTAPTFGHTATYDATGHLYAAGPCFDPGYPTTRGAFDLAHSGGQASGGYFNPDVAISRYSPDGQRLLYATYLGGRGEEYPHSLIVNHRGELLILGSTASPDFPTTAAAFDRTLGSAQQPDMFVAKLDSTGAQLLGSTYVGGSGPDGQAPFGLRFFYGDTYRGDLAIDSLDRVFVASSTQSADFPFTPGVVRPATVGFAGTAVVLRLAADLGALDWAAGMGTASAAYGLYVPPSGAPYVVGTTISQGFPTTPGALEPASAAVFQQRDGFVAQLAPDGSGVRAASYLRPPGGALSSSQSFFIQPDPRSTDVYVLGSSTGFYQMTAGTWGQANGGLVMQRLSADLSQCRWTTTLGRPVTYGGGRVSLDPRPDTDNLSPTAFLVDACGSVYVSGWGRTQGLPTTPDALQGTTRATGIGGDLYLVVLTPDAAALSYATFVGGSSVNSFYEEHVDGGTSRFDPQGRVYQAVCTNAHDFPTTASAWRATNSVGGGAYDEVAFKLDFEPRAVRAAAATATTGGLPSTVFEAPATVQFTNQSSQYPGTTWRWNFGDGSAGVSAFEPAHLYLNPGTFTVQLITTDPDACGTADTVYLQITILANDSTDLLAYTICRGEAVQLGPIGAAAGSFTWSPPGSLSSATAVDPIASPIISTMYAATGRLPGTSRRNTWRATVTVLQPDTALLTVERRCLPGGSEAQFRLNQPLKSGIWEFGDGSPPQPADPAQSVTHFYKYPGTYTAHVRGLDAHGCLTSTTALITADELFVPNIFTPNADGTNDTFVVGCLEPGTATLEVYNRWGRLVYDSGTGQYLNQWNGGGLAAGLYYYYLRLNYAPTPFKGWVEITR